ncbi:MAG: HD domain-containing protein [Oscillospiraceae bacterium]|nr:HD domain-containing protein [Oscillospiraceae bacterium]
MNRLRKTHLISFDFSGQDLEDLLEKLPLHLRSHSRRVAVSASIIAGQAEKHLMHYLPAGTNLSMYAHLAGTCHDIGKLLLPPLITDREIYQRHPEIGASILEKHRKTLFINDTQARIVIDTVRYHHENADGSGYPDSLCARDIPLVAGICAVANELDHHLAPEKGFGGDPGAVLFYIKSQAGTVFCDSAVDFLESAWPWLVEQYDKWKLPAG